MNRTIVTVATVFSASSLLLVDSAVKGTVLLALAAVVVLILRRDSAATRHLVWLLAIVAMLVVPLLSAMLPQWRVLPAWVNHSPKTAVVDVGSPAIVGPADVAVELPQIAEPVEVEQPSATAHQPPAAIPDSQPALVTTQAAPAPPVLSWQWITALPLVWVIGFSVLILRLSAARWMLWNSERRATVVCRRVAPQLAFESRSDAATADDPIVMAMETICSQLGISHPVTLLIHPDKTIPVVWGILRCRLMLPAAARLWSDEQLQSVLLHELAHLKRRDTIVQLLAQVACALHWFNPLVWFAAWRLDVERERSCDDLVLASGIRPSAYAGHLLDVVTGLSPARWTQSCGLAMARKSSLEGRLTAVLGKDLNRRDVSVALAGLALAIAVGVAVPIAMLRAADEKWNPPHGAHIGGNDFSALCVHDGKDASFVIVYHGDFDSTNRSSSNSKDRTWTDSCTITAKKPGIALTFHRTHTAPGKLSITTAPAEGRDLGKPAPPPRKFGQKEYNLTKGRVFLLSDSGDVRQLDIATPVVTDQETAKTLASLIAAIPPQEREDVAPMPNHTGKLAPETIAKLKWGEPVNGLRMALAYPPALGDALLGKKPHFELVVQNVSEKEIHFLASDEAPNPRRLLIREGERIVLGLSDPEVSAADWKLQPGQCGVLRMYTKEERDKAGTIPSSAIESDLSKIGRYHAIVQMEIAKAPPGAWTGKLVTGQTRGSADVAVAPAPMHKDARAYYEVWQRYARANGDIPGALVGELAASVKTFIRYNPTWETVPKLNAILPRLDATHDWKPADAIALLDEVAGIQDSPIKAAPWRGTRHTIRKGEALPKKFADATWGEAQPNGLRAAWVLEPNATEHRIGAALKARLLVQNTGSVSVVLQVPTWHQGWVKARDAKGKEVEASGLEWTTLAQLVPVRLAPGEYIEINTPGIGFGPRAGMGPWAGPRVGSNVLAKAGDELTLTHGLVPLDGSEVGVSEDDPHVSGPGWWLAHVRSRLNRELPLPADAAERTRLLDRAVRELFATAPSAEETTAFIADKTPDALDALAKRLVARVDVVSFSGKLPTAPAKFRVLAADANADKQPRVVLGPGEYPLSKGTADRGAATLKIVGRPVGDRRTNDTQLLFEATEFTGALPPDAHKLEVPDGWGTWAIVCRPSDGYFYLLHKGSVRKIDYSAPRKVTDTPVNDLPAEFRDEVKRQLDIHEISDAQQAEMFEKPAAPAASLRADEQEKPKTAATELQPKTTEKVGFTAWGKEVGGLQAGLGFLPGQQRAYSHGETVKVVLRVRNVGKEAVDFKHIWAFFVENSPAITDADGKLVQLPRLEALGEHGPRSTNVAPGKEVELYEWEFDLRPKGEGSKKEWATIHGVGKFSLQCERVVGPTGSNPNHPNPALGKFATGKLELEIKPVAPPQQETPKPKSGAMLMPATEQKLKWGEPVNGLRMALAWPPTLGEAAMGDAPEFYLVVQNVSEMAVRLTANDAAPNPRMLNLYDATLVSRTVDDVPIPGDWLLQPREAAFLRLFHSEQKFEDGRTSSVLKENVVSTLGQYSYTAEMTIEKAPAGAWTGKLVTGATRGSADVLDAGKPIALRSAPPMSWGVPNDGLRGAWRIIGEMRTGGQAKAELWVWNASTDVVKFSWTERADIGLAVMMSDGTNTAREAPVTRDKKDFQLHYLVLPAGQAVKLKEFAVRLGSAPDNAPAGTVSLPLTPGDWTLQAKWSDTRHIIDAAPEWHGVLDTGEVKLKVTPEGATVAETAPVKAKWPPVRQKTEWSDEFRAHSKEVAEARGTPDAKPEDLIAWGAEENGLRAGLLVAPRVTLGGQLPTRMVLRNVTNDVRELGLSLSLNRLTASAQTPDGKSLQVHKTQLRGLDALYKVTLTPGEQVEFEGPPVQFGVEHDGETKKVKMPKYPICGVETGAGKVHVHFEVEAKTGEAVVEVVAANKGADARKPAAKPPGANIVKVPNDQYVKSGFPADELVGEGVMWNDVQNGLSLGYRITGEEWRLLGKDVKVELWVRNPGDKDVKFQLNMRPDIGLRMKLKGEKGAEHESSIVPNDVPPLGEHRLLPPGHALKVKEFTVSLLWPENDVSGIKAHYFAIAPGAYNFHCELDLPGFSATGEGGKQLTPAEGEWTGKLTTRDTFVMVIAPDAPAPKPRIEHVWVRISKDGEVSLDRKQMSLDELKTRAARFAKKWFTIEADEEVPYAKVIEVVEALKASGVTEFSFAEARVGDGKYRVANLTANYDFDGKHHFSICRPSEYPQFFTVNWPAEGERPACWLRTYPSVSGQTQGKWAVVWEPGTNVLWWVDDSHVGKMTLTDPAHVIMDREGRTNNFSRDFGLPEDVKTEFRRLGFVIGRDKTPGLETAIGGNTGGQSIVSAEFGMWSVKGTVTDADGKPLANVPVRVSTNQELKTEKTDAKGEYRAYFSLPLQLLAHWRGITVEPMLEGFTERDMAKTGKFNVLLRAGEEPQHVRLAGDKDFQPGPIPRFAERDLLPSQRGAFPGKPGRADFVMLKAAEIIGELVTADGKPTPPHYIAASTPEQRPGHNAAIQLSDDKGHFRLKGIPTNKPVIFTVNPDGKARETSKSSEQKFEQAREHKLRIVLPAEGSGKGPVKIERLTNAASAPAEGAIRGKVLKPDGSFAAGVPVRVDDGVERRKFRGVYDEWVRIHHIDAAPDEVRSINAQLVVAPPELAMWIEEDGAIHREHGVANLPEGLDWTAFQITNRGIVECSFPLRLSRPRTSDESGESVMVIGTSPNHWSLRFTISATKSSNSFDIYSGSPISSTSPITVRLPARIAESNALQSFIVPQTPRAGDPKESIQTKHFGITIIRESTK